MTSELIDTLPLAQRLALSYAPRRARTATLALMALDTRLAGIVRTGGEPVIAQMKMAWWRERLAQDPASWPLGEPLLGLLRDAEMDCARLIPLVDGWELLLAEQLQPAAVELFAQGRAEGWLAAGEAVARDLPAAPVVQAATAWAMIDLALNLGTVDEAEQVRAHAQGLPDQTARLPRELRPLAVLHGLAARAVERGAENLLDGPGAMLAALRLGIVGR